MRRKNNAWTVKGGIATNEHGVMIDEEDLPVVQNFYVRMDVYPYFTMNRVRHRLHNVLCPSEAGMFTDHKNQNKLDNRRCNLRSVSIGKSNFNRVFNGDKTSRYRGVSKYHCTVKGNRYSYWRASISLNRKHIAIAVRKDEKEAARMYVEAVKRIYGEVPPEYTPEILREIGL